MGVGPSRKHVEHSGIPPYNLFSHKEGDFLFGIVNLILTSKSMGSNVSFL